jgi:hypothetical protein
MDWDDIDPGEEWERKSDGGTLAPVLVTLTLRRRVGCGWGDRPRQAKRAKARARLFALAQRALGVHVMKWEIDRLKRGARSVHIRAWVRRSEDPQRAL